VRREDADRLIAEGKILEGVEVFRKVVEADPTAKNHGDFGSLLYRVTAFDEAAIHLQAAAELDPGNADRWIALANVYYRKVDPGAAWKAEKRAREAEPGLELGRDSEGMRVRKGETAPRQP
jgi:tetratricopeptide (TPR) repeat protein